METIKLETNVGEDGVLRLELSRHVTNQKLEVVEVIQPLEELESVDELGWPIGFFDRTYGALADDPIERPAELPPEVRDMVECTSFWIDGTS